MGGQGMRMIRGDLMLEVYLGLCGLFGDSTTFGFCLLYVVR